MVSRVHRLRWRAECTSERLLVRNRNARLWTNANVAHISLLYGECGFSFDWKYNNKVNLKKSRVLTNCNYCPTVNCVTTSSTRRTTTTSSWSTLRRTNRQYSTTIKRDITVWTRYELREMINPFTNIHIHFSFKLHFYF